MKTLSYLLKKEKQFFQTELLQERNSLKLTFTGPVVGYVIEATMVQLDSQNGQDDERIG